MSLKILHVGNIAQNGYINASILRAHGHDCDLIAPDLYHAASSPEWYELAHFDIDTGVLGKDSFFPNFYALNDSMPKIGLWVAQGPMMQCMRYLLLARQNKPLAHLAMAVMHYLRFKITIQKNGNAYQTAWSEKEFSEELDRFNIPYLHRIRIITGRIAERYYNWIKSRIVRLDESMASQSWSPPLPHGMIDFYFSKDPALEGVMRALRKKGLSQALGLEFSGPLMEYDHLVAHGFEVNEVVPYCWSARMWRELAAQYDICIFYGDSSKYAYTAGLADYWALEHGSIRTLPFEGNVNARVITKAFEGAKKVFLTNTDYATAQPRIEFTDLQRVYFPHPFNEAAALQFSRNHQRRIDPNRVVFFCPARHDWTSGHLKEGKSNDTYIRAARMLFDLGHRDFELRCVEWGSDVSASRDLVSMLGLSEHVVWSPIMPKGQVWSAMLNAHAVVDQFLVSAIGAVTLEGLALGCRVITRDDGVNNSVFFPEPPPVMPAATAHELTQCMMKVMHDPLDTNGIGRAGQKWVQRFHSSQRIYEIQMAAYHEV